ncbi:reverse transcriptase domain-containing protein, partial [Tanacetum coccineum]
IIRLIVFYKDAPALHAIGAGKVQKKNNKNKKPQLVARGNNQGKGKSKLAYAPKPKIPPLSKKENPAKDSVCHQCGDTGHWKRNCPQYLSGLLKNKKLSQGASTSGIFTVELFSFPGKSWVYDTGCGTHICNTTQGLRGSRKLKPGALSLYMGNGQRAVFEAIGSYHLCFPSGLVVILHNCHYAPSSTRGGISVSRLYDDGFINRFENNAISVSRNNLVYFCAVLRDGSYEIDLSNSNTNDSSMYAISNKRAKLNLDSALLWHYRLGHISNKRIEKLQQDGLLNSTDIHSFEKCVSCMSRKMARKPYSHQVERAKDLLKLIHTDVCGPFRTVSRQGASYFVTFTDDFSRYGYVYLLKHKHEVFETFKVFQKEVENQLGKTIKSLRSDRGGEYMSQEFLDHLKEHGILSHRTPPYTPQHNGVSKRRNRTLPDMVCSMMSQTTLPKSFWDYAFESAACILNMVLTKRLKRYHTNLITQEASGSLEDLEIIQEEDTHPSENTSLHHDEGDQEINEPQSDIIPIRKSTRTRHAPDRMCLNIDAEEYELGDLNEPDNYKDALLDPESGKWLNAMNVEMQSMKDNEDVKSYLGRCFAMKDLEEDVYILGIKIYRDRSGRLIGLCQSAYIEKILKSFFMENSKRGSVVDWKSTKQSIFATSSAEAEYIVALDASKEAVWVRKFIFGLGVILTIEEPIKMYCDNTGAITIANESGITKSARHYHAKVYYLREVIELGDVKIEKVHTDDNSADPFTKALPFPKHLVHTKNIGMLPASSLM